MALNLSCQNRQHPHADRGLDLYETPPVATEALLRVESLPQRIWEPAAGRGAIVRALRAAGHEVVASDIRTYDFDLDFESDFLAATKAPAGIELLLTNPPYRLAAEFVAQALRLCPRVIMLCMLAFLESARRAPILDAGQLARIHVFKRRLPMMHRHGWTGPRASSAMAFGWFIWNRDHVGPTTVGRVSWGD
jgi:hypothetical protein